MIPEIFIHQTSWYIVAVQVSRRKKKSSKNLYFLRNQLHDQLQPQSFKIPVYSFETGSKLVRKIDIVSIPSTMRRKNNRNKQIRKHVNGICSILLDGKLETVVHACRGKVSADYVYGRLCSLRNTPPRVGKAVSRERDPRESGPPLLRDTTNFSLLGDPVFRMYYIVHDVNYFNPGVRGCCANFSQPRCSVSRQPPPGNGYHVKTAPPPCNLTRLRKLPSPRTSNILICFLHRSVVSILSNNIVLQDRIQVENYFGRGGNELVRFVVIQVRLFCLVEFWKRIHYEQWFFRIAHSVLMQLTTQAWSTRSDTLWQQNALKMFSIDLIIR